MSKPLPLTIMNILQIFSVSLVFFLLISNAPARDNNRLIGKCDFPPASSGLMNYPFGTGMSDFSTRLTFFCQSNIFFSFFIPSSSPVERQEQSSPSGESERTTHSRLHKSISPLVDSNRLCRFDGHTHSGETLVTQSGGPFRGGNYSE